MEILWKEGWTKIFHTSEWGGLSGVRGIKAEYLTLGIKENLSISN